MKVIIIYPLVAGLIIPGLISILVGVAFWGATIKRFPRWDQTTWPFFLGIFCWPKSPLELNERWTKIWRCIFVLRPSYTSSLEFGKQHLRCCSSYWVGASWNTMNFCGLLIDCCGKWPSHDDISSHQNTKSQDLRPCTRSRYNRFSIVIWFVYK